MSTKDIKTTTRVPFAQDNRQRLSAATWNLAARIINERVLAGPQDLDGGAEGQLEDRTWYEQERTTTIVRVENPDNPDQWVDVSRIQAVAMLDPGTKRITWLRFNNPTTE